MYKNLKEKNMNKEVVVILCKLFGVFKNFKKSIYLTLYTYTHINE